MPVTLRKVVLGHPRTFLALAVTAVTYLMLPEGLACISHSVSAEGAF